MCFTSYRFLSTGPEVLALSNSMAECYVNKESTLSLGAMQ